MHPFLAILLAGSAFAAAMPEPDWSRAGITGLVVYAILHLSLALIESRRDRGHRDDCALLLRQIRSDVEQLLQRSGPAHGRHPKS